ncbi:hypothetical protein [Halpernia sp.]|uniref:hypothetical protein n=1 Tax=Halpernia sp. TaxID=2782209 RepID=UPI003A9369C2
MTMLSAFWPFYQFLWTVYFVIMFLIGFWAIFMFFSFVIPLWLTEGLWEYFGKSKAFDPEEVRFKKIYEQEGVEIIYNEPKGRGPYLHESHAAH